MDEIKKLTDIDHFKLLSQGNTAEVYELEENKILKLFRQSMPLEAINMEYRISSEICQCIKDVPRVYEMVVWNERYGIVYEKITGTDMISCMLKNVFLVNKYSRKLAEVHYKMHQENADIHRNVKDKLTEEIYAAKDFTDQEKKNLAQYISTLPDGESICHLDFHPGNVLMCNKKRL